MGRVHQLEHRGAAITVLDFAHISDTAEALAAVEEAGAHVQRQPAKSVLVLTDVSGSRFNTKVLDAIKELVVGNGPHVKASAIVGMTGLHRVAYTLISRFSGRQIPTFSTRDAALDWLASQA